jgi:formylglycine-generating enzyme required for sulfatase activity
VDVKGDSFVMGTLAADIPRLKELFGVDFPGIFENASPAHRVSIDDYRIDRHEVTNSQFAEFVAANPQWRRDNLDPDLHNGHYLEHWQQTGPVEGSGDHPVVFITWASAQAFCGWREGRLPSEAEWEFAARAGDDREFPWGAQMPAPELVNYYADGIDATTAVGSYPPNVFGLYDMAGNVWEFMHDEWLPR